MKNFFSKTAKDARIYTIFASVVLFIAGVLCMSQSVSAQSALDSFNPNPNGRIRATLVQPDGKIIIGGNFTTILGVSRKYIARLNPDGTLDPTFAPNANNSVTALALQPDGKLIIGGLFTGVSHGNGPVVTRNNIARFNVNTSLDTTFDPNLNNTVWSIAVQPNGKIVAGGMFTTAAPNGGATVTRNHIARFETDGTLDAAFDPNVDGDINALAIHTDGRIVVGGKFTSVAPNGGTSYNRENIARFNTDGTLDATVNLGVAGYIFSLVIQPDGKFIVGGGFSDILMNGAVTATRNCIARFNTDGTLDTTFCPSVNNYIFSLAIQPDGKILVGGSFSNVAPNGGAAVSRNNIARVNLNGSLDTAFNPNTNNRVSAMAVQTDGKIIIGGEFSNIGGVARSNVMRLEKGGLCDLWLNQNTNNTVITTALQPDGKILVGGDFTTIGGVTRNRLARLNADSTLDTAFNPNVNGTIYAILVQPDGKIIIGGDFTAIGSVTRTRIARLNVNGSVDNSFSSSANNTVRALAAQSDGKILVGGAFTTITGMSRSYIARITADGWTDGTFNANANNQVNTIVVQQFDQILVGGDFTSIGGQARSYIAQLFYTGMHSYYFNQTANGSVTALAVQPNGKILIGGNFTNIGGQPRTRLARLYSDGLVEAGFYPEVNAAPASIAVQSDGKILLGGAFTMVSGYPHNYIARLNASGTLDWVFNAYANAAVRSLMVQPDGRILVGGNFTQIGGQARSYFARLNNTAAALSNLDVYPTIVLLTRDETAVQFSRVVIEQSIDNGTTWTMLGATIHSLTGSDINDKNDASIDPYMPTSHGYVLRGQNIPTGQNVLIRARGYYRAGDKNGSEIVEDKVQNVFLPAPTAGNVSISGRVIAYDYSGLRNALVKLELANGDVVLKRTSAFGYFEFDEIAAGQTVTISVPSINYSFSPQTINVTDNVTDLEFTAN